MPDTILPPLRRTAADAAKLAIVAHEGQLDKAGLPYIEHIERVVARTGRALRARGISPPGPLFDQTMQIAWLHDVIEDTDYTRLELADEGFQRDVINGVEYLSNNAPVRHTYQSWIQSLCLHAPLPVLIVKLADMEDNADPERLALLPDDVRARLERKYREPLEMLRTAVERGAGR